MDRTESIREVTLAGEADLARIFEIWESSVRATHTFLTEADIQSLIPVVKKVLAHFSPLHCLRDADGRAFAFLGVAEAKIEMLFVHADHRRRGAGRTLTEYAIGALGAEKVDVNEQNEQAVGFYKHLGFRQFSRSSRDSCGNPFPIVHMALCADRRSMSLRPGAVWLRASANGPKL